MAEDANIFPTSATHKNAMFSFRAREFLGIDTSHIRTRTSVANVVVFVPPVLLPLINEGLSRLLATLME